MVCIYCGSETKVTNSRHQRRANNVWRRRQCVSCNTVFSTIESPDIELSITIRQSNGRLEPFLRDKLLVSVYDSLKHRKSALTDATALTATIVTRAYELADQALIERDALVEITYVVLERFDTVAATHYQAYHPIS